MSSLFVVKGRDQGRKYELSSDVIRLGRDENSALPVNDREVSRVHAELRRSGDAYELIDLESSNGTFVNEQPVSRYQLKNGDRIRVGKTTLIFTSSSAKRDLNRSDLVKLIQTPFPESASKIVSSLQADTPLRIEPKSEATDFGNNGLNLVYHAALAVSQTLDIDQLIEKLLLMIFDAIQPDRGCILLRDPESDQLMPRIMRDRLDESKKGEWEISRSIVDYVVENLEGVITSDAINDDRWDSNASILRMGVSEAICVPMQGRYGNQGAIYIDTRTTPGRLAEQKTLSKFSNEHLKLMIAIGHQAALAIEDTNFYSAMIQSERMAAMGQTIAMLSHHIKNILQGINGGAYLVKNGIQDEDVGIIQQGWGIVEKNQTKISQLVMDMLSFSKQRDPDLEMGELEKVIEEVIELVQHRASNQKLELSWKKCNEFGAFYFDFEGIHRAILNIVSNALDACENRPDSRISIDLHLIDDSQSIEIHIMDNGPGIPEANLEKVFGAFESGKGNRGTGLGLPVSRKIFQEHGGDIRIQSTEGNGTTFIMSLPYRSSLNEGQTMEIPEEGTNPQHPDTEFNSNDSSFR